MLLSYIMDLPSILLAINLSAPGLSAHTANYYGKILLKESIRTEVSPLIGIAIIEHESRWNPSKISKDGFDYGLMQIRARFSKHPQYLLEGGSNIRTGFGWIDSSKDFCEKELGREPETQEWLSCFQGSCRLNHRCKPTKLTRRVEMYAECLESCLMDNVSRDCEQIYIKEPRR